MLKLILCCKSFWMKASPKSNVMSFVLLRPGLLHAGDRIIEVNGFPVDGMEPEQVIQVVVRFVFIGVPHLVSHIVVCKNL